jgi:hypothetical protein
MAKCHYCGVNGATYRVRMPVAKDYFGPPPRPKAFDLIFCSLSCKDEFYHSCWKGDRGPGKQLKEMIKEHNNDKRRTN